MRLLVVLLLGTAGLGWGTSCDPRALGPLCGQFREGTVLFFGIVVDKSQPVQGHWARFAVKEIYQGLPPGTEEVIVNPGSWSSFTVGESYLLTANVWMDFGPKPWTWDRLKWWWYSERHQPPGLRLQSWDCSYAREERRVREEDWAYARALRDGTHRRRIYGRVSVKGLEWYGGDGRPPLAGATVRIHRRSKSLTTLADGNGDYSVENVDPGHYWVEAEARGYTSTGQTPELDVTAQGCGFGPLAMTAVGRIAGSVIDPNGTPAAGAKMSYRFAEPRWRGTLGSTTTNEKGEFSWNEIPPGELLIEAQAYGSDDPYTAMRVQLGLNEVRKGIVFRLAPTPPKRVITVRARWPDGRLAAGVEVHGRTNGSYTERRATGADGTAQLSLFSGHPYSVFASVQVDGQWTGAGARVEPQTDSVDLVIVKAAGQSR